MGGVDQFLLDFIHLPAICNMPPASLSIFNCAFSILLFYPPLSYFTLRKIYYKIDLEVF